MSLERELGALTAAVEHLNALVQQLVDKLDRHIDRDDSRFDGVERRFDRVEQLQAEHQGGRGAVATLRAALFGLFAGSGGAALGWSVRHIFGAQ